MARVLQSIAKTDHLTKGESHVPQFALEGRNSLKFRDLSEIVRGYIEAAFFTSGGDPGEGGIPEEMGFFDLAPEALAEISAVCERFAAENADAIEACGLDLEQVGRDFWFTRNGHGVGFWDREASDETERDALGLLTDAAHGLGESDLYLGDDGRVYV